MNFCFSAKELLEEGSGEVPKTGDYVEMHYVGTFHNSTKVFDSSRAKNRTFKFQLGKTLLSQNAST